MRYTNRWVMPEVTFYQVEDHGFSAHEGRPLYAYGKPDETGSQPLPQTGEMYDSLDRALISWIAEKYTGPRGAGGTGVGTAADWFARMIGMDDVVPVDYRAGQKALREVLAATSMSALGPHSVRANRMTDELEARGLVLAARKFG